MTALPPESPSVASSELPQADARPAPMKTAHKPVTTKPAKPSVAKPAPPFAVTKSAARARKPGPFSAQALAPTTPAEQAPAKASKERARLVRDSFTMPEADFALISTLKLKAMAAQRHAKKSELLRAGLRVLSELNARKLVQTLDALEPVKIGRPKKGHGVKK